MSMISYPAIPLRDYGAADLEREFNTVKECAPFCTIGCVHRASSLDGWRGRQELRVTRPADPARAVDSPDAAASPD